VRVAKCKCSADRRRTFDHIRRLRAGLNPRRGLRDESVEVEGVAARDAVLGRCRLATLQTLGAVKLRLPRASLPRIADRGSRIAVVHPGGCIPHPDGLARCSSRAIGPRRTAKLDIHLRELRRARPPSMDPEWAAGRLALRGGAWWGLRAPLLFTGSSQCRSSRTDPSMWANRS